MRISRISTSPPAASSSWPLMSPNTSIASAPKPAAPVTSTLRPSARSACARSRMSVTESRKSSPVPPVSRTCVMTSTASPSSDGIGPSVPAVMIGGSSVRSRTRPSAALRSSGVRPPSRAMIVTAAATWPSGNCSIASSALTDSASPGRKRRRLVLLGVLELAGERPHRGDEDEGEGEDEELRDPLRGKREQLRHPPPDLTGMAAPYGYGWPHYSSNMRSSSGSVTGRRQAKRSHT